MGRERERQKCKMDGGEWCRVEKQKAGEEEEGEEEAVGKRAPSRPIPAPLASITTMTSNLFCTTIWWRRLPN